MIRHALLVGIFVFALFTQAQAGASGFFGISYVFGTSPGDIGLTVKVLSDDEENSAVLAAGVSYYPLAEEKKFGADLSGGYLFESVAVTGGWDFLRWKPQLAVGYVNTKNDKSTPSTPPTPPTPSTPE